MILSSLVLTLFITNAANLSIFLVCVVDACASLIALYSLVLLVKKPIFKVLYKGVEEEVGRTQGSSVLWRDHCQLDMLLLCGHLLCLCSKE